VTGYPRDLAGYGATPPDPRWPGGARLALQIAVNYEEGSEWGSLLQSAWRSRRLPPRRRSPPEPAQSDNGTLCHGDGPKDGATAAEGLRVAYPHRRFHNH